MGIRAGGDGRDRCEWIRRLMNRLVRWFIGWDDE